MIEQIEKTIRTALPDATVYVFDPQNDGQHFESIVISPSFQGMSLVKQHQAVMKSLKSEFETSVHALRLKTFTPEAWEASKHEYGILE